VTPRQALEALYDAINGDGWTASAGWKGLNDLNTWHQVTATSNTVVTVVNLIFNNLVGEYTFIC
jgi:hypothetical protein